MFLGQKGMEQHHIINMHSKEIRFINELIIEKSNDKFIILDPSQGIFFETNSTGNAVIEFIKNYSSYDDMLAKLNSKYKDFDKTSLDNFINLLLKKKLIKID